MAPQTLLGDVIDDVQDTCFRRYQRHVLGTSKPDELAASLLQDQLCVSASNDREFVAPLRSMLPQDGAAHPALQHP